MKPNREMLRPNSTRYTGIGISKIKEIRKQKNIQTTQAHMAGGGLFGYK